MKKFLSMLLVLCMVVTTLMGTMVMDVSAVDFTRDPDTKEITLAFGTPTLPNALEAWNSFSVGNWYGHGYTYAESDIDDFFASTATTITGTATEKVNYLETAVVENALDPITGNMTKYDFKGGTITDGSKAAHTYATGKSYDTTMLFTQDTTSIGKVSPNYSRLAVFPQPLGSSSSKSYSWTALKKTDLLGSNEAATAYKFTFYAYTQDVTSSGKGDTISFELRNFSGGNITFSILDDYLVSTNGVPHKVDLVLSSDGTYGFAHLYVDGVEMSNGIGGKAPNADSLAFQPRFELNSLASGASMDFNTTDWYITQFSSKTAFTSIAQADLNSELFIVPNYTATKKSTTARTDDYITGVIDSLDADIKAVLEDSTAGDNVVDIYESNYNNPASLYTDTENTTVKLISRTTGDEAAVAGATGTMDDYYFMVNGVYVIPNKVADYVKHTKDPFTVSAAQHGTIDTRMKWENYEDNTVAADQPAFGGLRNGFLKFTNEPRGSFTFSGGGVYYNQAGFYNIKMPGMIEIGDSTYDVPKSVTTLQFDMYAPEYTYSSTSNSMRMALSGFRNEVIPYDKDNNVRAALPTIYFTTNGKASANVPSGVVDLVGNAWNNVAIQFDATNTPTTGKLDIIVYVNGEKQLETQSSVATYGDTAKAYISFLEYARLYVPAYTSVGIMNDAWYIGGYTPVVTATTENAIDPASVSGVTVSVDNTNNIIAYDNSDDADYASLITAMEAAGYTAVYDQVVDVALVDAKYDEVDGDETYKSTARTHTGVLVKKWIESSLTDGDIVNNGDTDGDGKNDYTIVDTNITSAVDNGDGTATMVVTSSFANQTVYPGVASTTDEIVALLEAEGKVGRTKTLVGFTSVNETGLLPRVYTLQGAGTELYSLAYDATSKTATLTYREFGGTENIPLMMIVAAYDAKGKLLDLDASETITIDVSKEDGVKTETFTADFGELDLTTVKTYKIFVFDSLTTSVPLMASSGVVNSAYVAPVE